MGESQSPSSTNERTAVRVIRVTLIGNVALTVFKLLAGLLANSAAMVSDAVHSLSDVMGEIIVLIGVKLSNRKSDKEHPYGHERMECVAGLILAFILFAVGAIIGWGGLQKIIGGNYGELTIPGTLALVAAIVSIVVKEAMYRLTISAAKKINSVAMKASAWHHRSDAMSSIGSFAGILGARLGLPILDSIACVVICIFIFKVSIDIFREAVSKMTDTACDDEFVEEIKKVVLAQDSVMGVDLINTRLFGDKVYVDIEINSDGDASLNEAHSIAQRVHDAIESSFPSVKHCMVHINPVDNT
ncbi:MAG: cation diffusion facilitator family transporter [Oscillospiraceae bacterium]|nr:cation diffusion facilitator family transporter [Oscillospiraceae bacterium]